MRKITRKVRMYRGKRFYYNNGERISKGYWVVLNGYEFHQQE